MLSLECSLRSCAETTCSNACVVIMTSVHMTCKHSQNLVRMEGVLITPKKVSDCKDEDLDEIMEELESIAFQIRSDIDQISIRYSLRYLRFLPEEEIQEKLQSIHEFIMRLADENKALKRRVTVLEGTVTVVEGENKELKGRVTVLEGEVKKLKHELESLRTDILTGEVIKGVETKIIDLLGGDGSHFTLNHVVNKLNNPARLIEEEVFRSEDEVKEANKRWKKLKEQYKLKLKDVAVMKSLRVQWNQRAHPEIGTTVTAMKKVIQSTRDEKIQEVMEKLLPIVQDYRI